MRWSYAPQTVFNSPIHLIAFGFGSGLPKIAPGTWGSIAALPVYALTLAYCPLWLQWILIALAFVLGVWICGESAKRIGVKDHPGIVWDEWVGLWLTLSCLPSDWIWWLLGLLAFRLFDIAKPGPIGWLDKRLEGGLGIMADDLLAGLLAGGLLLTAHLILASY
jgi:phosphatidylglycerophosphatase A